MTYVISDIHGCYSEFCELLQKINFSDNDFLYILGDICDRGPKPIDVFLDVMKRPNAKLILGNHDFVFAYIMKQLVTEITEESCETVLTSDFAELHSCWMQDGGKTTEDQYSALSNVEKLDILKYLADAPLYGDIQVGENRYVLVHAGLDNFSPNKPLGEYTVEELLECRTNYSRRYFEDEHTFLVTGHTPTAYINRKVEVYRENGHIAIDCGCVFGGRLAAYCFETGEVTYVKGKRY